MEPHCARYIASSLHLVANCEIATHGSEPRRKGWKNAARIRGINHIVNSIRVLPTTADGKGIYITTVQISGLAA